MARIDDPSVSVSKKSNEQNMAAMKSWAGGVTDSINYHEQLILDLIERVTALESEDSE